MTALIRVVTELTIAEGKTGEYKKIETGVIEKVKATPGVLSFEVFFNDDESKAYVLEWFKDSEAFLAFLGAIEKELGLLLAVVQPTRLQCFGDASDALKQAITPFGATFYKHWAGYTR